ncbi:hypothetical protein CDAR_19651 [Caerostris darwini]|uniref:Uncharacterized protein n=1 Tax=Caerostris darwini TaxID=1538125 RepID=A0AAV4QHR4_9ARAC|nr:hypothetical protein CDAR_19651 [Caerostris darwini]
MIYQCHTNIKHRHNGVFFVPAGVTFLTLDQEEGTSIRVGQDSDVPQGLVAKGARMEIVVDTYGQFQDEPPLVQSLRFLLGFQDSVIADNVTESHGVAWMRKRGKNRDVVRSRVQDTAAGERKTLGF